MVWLEICRSLSRSNSREDGEPNDEEDDDCGDIEKGKPRGYKKNDKCLIQRRVSRMAHLFGGWFLYTSKRRRIVGLGCPPGVGTSLVGGFRKIILFCGKNRFSPRDAWREDWCPLLELVIVDSFLQIHNILLFAAHLRIVFFYEFWIQSQ